MREVVCLVKLNFFEKFFILFKNNWIQNLRSILIFPLYNSPFIPSM